MAPARGRRPLNTYLGSSAPTPLPSALKAVANEVSMAGRWDQLARALTLSGCGALRLSLTLGQNPAEAAKFAEMWSTTGVPRRVAKAYPLGQRPVLPSRLELRLGMDAWRGSFVHGPQAHQLAGEFFLNIWVV